MPQVSLKMEQQIDREAEHLTRKFKEGTDYLDAYKQGVKDGYGQGATAYAEKAQLLADALEKAVEHFNNESLDFHKVVDECEEALAAWNEGKTTDNQQKV